MLAEIKKRWALPSPEIFIVIRFYLNIASSILGAVGLYVLQYSEAWGGILTGISGAALVISNTLLKLPVKDPNQL